MSALVLSVVVATVGLCLSICQFAACVHLLWRGCTEQLRYHLLLRTALSAVLIIITSLLERYFGDETGAPILLVSITTVLAIIQVSDLTARFGACIKSPVWLVGPVIICSIIKLQLCVLLATSRQEDVQSTMLNAVLCLLIFEYSVMGLQYLTIFISRKSGISSTDQNRGNKGIKQANAFLVWNTIVCLIITVAATILLTLYHSGIVSITTCLSIHALAAYSQMLESIWLILRKWIRITQNGNEMYPLSSVTGSNAALSA